MSRNLIVAVLPIMLLTGCKLAQAGAAMDADTSRGRYSGIGTFDAGELWRRMKDVPESQAEDAARISDDEHVIVVVDTRTGEVRQCGDHSGYCVAMNPWNGKTEPVSLKLHADGLDNRHGEAAASSSGQ